MPFGPAGSWLSLVREAIGAQVVPDLSEDGLDHLLAAPVARLSVQKTLHPPRASIPHAGSPSAAKGRSQLALEALR